MSAPTEEEVRDRDAKIRAENPGIEAALSTMEVEIEGAVRFARERLDEEAHPRPELVQPPEVTEAIEAELMLTVYNARRLARRRLLRLEPGPIATPRAVMASIFTLARCNNSARAGASSWV